MRVKNACCPCRGYVLCVLPRVLIKYSPSQLAANHSRTLQSITLARHTPPLNTTHQQNPELHSPNHLSNSNVDDARGKRDKPHICCHNTIPLLVTPTTASLTYISLVGVKVKTAMAVSFLFHILSCDRASMLALLVVVMEGKGYADAGKVK